MKKTATSALVLCFLFSWGWQNLYAQGNGNNTVLFRNGTVRLPANTGAFAAPDGDEVVNGQFFRIIQFDQIPSAEQHRSLEQAGIQLLDYVPHKAYIASLPTSVNALQLKSFGIRSIIPVPMELKVADNLRDRPFPAWALKKDKLEVMIKYYASVPLENVLAYCRAGGIEIIRQNGANNFLLAAIGQDKVEEVSRLPFIAYLELAPEPGEPEDVPGRGLHRANAIDTELPSGRHYSGEGVNVLVRDDGFVGPHIDFHGRMSQDVSSDGGINHADGVSGIFAGAGNLDPRMRGMAAGAYVYVINYQPDFLDNTLPLHIDNGVLVTNTSYSNGCNAGYTAAAQTVDQQLHEYPTFLHVFSAGNSNGAECGYGAGDQWGNITGGHKQSKNSIATANLYADASLENSSSRGPAYDGRLKPDISANGQNQYSTAPDNEYYSFGGTSGAAPGIAGVTAQLHQAFSEANPGQIAEGALLKAILLNTANEIGNPGPDFKYGWGIVNAYRAALAIEEGRYFEGVIDQDGVNTHQISIPAGVKKARVMVYWNDKEGSELAFKALVTNLDIELADTDGAIYQPLVLNSTPNPALLDLPAVPGTDSLNNMEQVSLTGPAPGDYTLKVDGTEVPFPGQKYWVTYDFTYDEITVTYPNGGEGLVPSETEYIHWDAYGNQGNFLVEYSTDNGTTWNTAATLSGGLRLYNWTVPNITTGKGRVRVSRDGVSGQNQEPFSILTVPANLQIAQACPDFIRVQWDSVPEATAYDVFLLGEMYMDSVGTTGDLFFDVPTINSNPTLDHWISVRAVGDDGMRSRRAIAIPWSDGLFNCPLENDLAITRIVSPNATLAFCGTTDVEVIVDVWNNGLSDQTNPKISYQLNNDPPVTDWVSAVLPSGDTVAIHHSIPLVLPATGMYNLRAWVELTNGTDAAGFNDTLGQTVSVVIYPGDGAPTGITETFENNIPPDYWQIVNVDGSYTFEATEVTGSDDQLTTAMWINNYDYADIGQEDALATVPFDLSNATGDTKLTFDLSYAVWDLETWWDAMRIDVYTDCGNTFAGTVYYKEKDVLATVPPQTSPFVPEDSTEWRKEAVGLGAFAGQSIVVHFINITGYGNNLYIDNVNIEDLILPEAGMLVSDSIICQGDAVLFEDNSTGNNLSHEWEFGTGAIPSEATGPGPYEVIYGLAGSQQARLVISDGNFTDTVYQVIEVQPLPVANFGYVVANDGVATFNNTSLYGSTFAWDFGDNASSQEFSPVHTYQETGVYTVTLTVTNDCGTQVISKEITVTITGVNDRLSFQQVRILPNPNKGIFEVVLEGFQGDGADIIVLDAAGRQVWTAAVAPGSLIRVPVDLGRFPKGTYELVVRTGREQQAFPIVVQ